MSAFAFGPSRGRLMGVGPAVHSAGPAARASVPASARTVRARRDERRTILNGTNGTINDHRPRSHRLGVCASFSALVVTPAGCRSGVPWVKLAKPLRYRCRLNGGGIEAEVPEGFESDFASVPRALWSILPPNGQWIEASVLHDYLYQRGGCSRFLADALLRDSMRVLGVSWWRRVLFFYAVRLFGWLYFRRDKRGPSDGNRE